MNKKIYLYSANNIFIKEFISIQEAVKFTNINRYKIARALGAVSREPTACKSKKIIDNKYIFSFIR